MGSSVQTCKGERWQKGSRLVKHKELLITCLQITNIVVLKGQSGSFCIFYCFLSTTAKGGPGIREFVGLCATLKWLDLFNKICPKGCINS